MYILPDDRFVRYVQALLIMHGAWSGPVTGVADPTTLAALDKVLPIPGHPTGGYAELSDDAFVRHVQWRLQELGFFAGSVGGNAGPITMEATQKALVHVLTPGPVAVASTRPLPWLAAGFETLGWHEIRDNAKLRAWLKTGRALGDPGVLPWCGDWVETCFKIGLPEEEFPGKLGENPFWALNWAYFGRRIESPAVGCAAYKSRNGGGHVCLPVGQSRDERTLYCIGGNQNNAVTIAAYPASDFIGFRFPKTWAGAPQDLPIMDGSKLPSRVTEL